MKNSDYNRRKFLQTAAITAGAALVSEGSSYAQKGQREMTGIWDVTRYGTKGDGAADDTVAVQTAINAASVTGGEVYMPPGIYRIDGILNVPTGVALQGSWEGPHHAAWKNGSTLFITGGRGKEDGSPTIVLGESSSIRGFTLLWPDQIWNNIVPYPWAIQGNGMHNVIENVTFANAYQGIRIGEMPWSELHLIRNVFGCVLRRGVFIDTTSDIGRIENVHFNPHYWMRSKHPSIAQDRDHTGDTAKYMNTNLEAFIFGRTDWEYVLNTFVYAAKIGYHFIETKSGSCNGQLLGIGADGCQVCLQIDGIQNIGIQVTNGEFTSFAGGLNTAILTSPSAGGAAQFVNCNFWANPGHVLWMQGKTAVTMANCHFVETSKTGALLADQGRLIVQGCMFDQPGEAIVINSGVSTAIVNGNVQPGGLKVRNSIGARAQIGVNEIANA